MKTYLIIPGLLFIISLCSCEKGEEGFFNNNTDNVFLKQLLYEGERQYEYTYNDEGQILEEKSKWHYTRHNYKNHRVKSSDHYIDPGIYSSSSFRADSAWNRKEWVNPGNTEKYSTQTYDYDGNNKLVKTSNYLGYSKYSYDENNRISRRTFFHDEKKTGYIDFSYDEKDNLVKKLHYFFLESGKAELQTTTEYKFDNKSNPYRAFHSLMIPGLHTNTNNIVKETYIIHFEVDEVIEETQITENKYEYNEKGYPVRRNGVIEYVY